jgi:hypothetical protein
VAITLLLVCIPIQGDFLNHASPIKSDSHSRTSHDIQTTWWSIQIIVEVDGKYLLREGPCKFEGDFQFVIEWSGYMEEDDGDFLLYRDRCKLKQWSAEETAFYPDSTSTKNTSDFSAVPALQMNYILKEKENLILDLFVEGVPIPQNSSDQKTVLVLPASAENTNILKLVEYDSYLQKGSNVIMIPEKAMRRMPVEKEFSWKWKHQGWREEQKKPLFVSSSHSAKLHITIDLYSSFF